MTKGPVDRKIVQRVRSESEQNERLLGRLIITALSTCGTLVGWMLLSQSVSLVTEQASIIESNDEFTAVDGVEMQYESLPNPTVAPIQIDFAPIPTLPTLPDLLPVPTLMPYVAQPLRADAAPVQNESPPMVVAAQADAGVAVAQAPVSEMPILRVVAQPTPPAIKVAPKPVIPANQRPATGGNSGGSN